MTELERLNHEVNALREEQNNRRTRALELIKETEQRRAVAQTFLDDQVSHPQLPYRLAACAVGDSEWNADRVAAFRAELDEAHRTVVECDLLMQGLNELVKADWLVNARLNKAIHRRDQEQRRAKLAAPAA
jgi:hypothetical protein